MSGATRILPVGESALSLELGEGIDPAQSARVLALDAALAADPFPGLRESLPSYRALLVVFDPRQCDRAAAAAALQGRLAGTGVASTPSRRHHLRACYDGPDLEAVARERSLSPRDVVALHAGREYTALMLGFRPGFAYLGLTDARLEVPRLATPRTRVPAGALALAGRQTAVYPCASPGGWRLIGHTATRLFDPGADEPALLKPGDVVVFEAVDELEPLQEAAPPAGSGAGEDHAVDVVEPGLLTSVQDLGRRGWLRSGVSWGGAVDAPAARAANRAAGNPDGAAVLECTGAGPTLRFLTSRYFAVAGADLGAVLERPDLGDWLVPRHRRVRARPGNVLRFAGRRTGFRSYVALAGGIDVPLVMGSRSTDLQGGFGGLSGRPLRAGDRLSAGHAHDRAEAPPPLELLEPADAVTLRVVPGPQEDHFDATALTRLYQAEFRLGADADRTGCRLDGPRLAARRAEIVTDAVLPGAIQIPPDGRPIVMLADAPTSGGYPKPGVVVSADLARLAQLAPGEGRVRFVRLEPERLEPALAESG